MPKYTFECPACEVQFERTLKMDEHPTHPCPSCRGQAPRVWMGQGFGFDFAAPANAAPANTGVAKHDYPTADQAVGSSADARWGEYNAREKVKGEVRKVGGNRALIRRNGQNYVEYEAGTSNLLDARKKLVKEADAQGWGAASGEAPNGKASGDQ